MSGRWTVYADAQAAAVACLHTVTARLLLELGENDRASLAISGGASPKPLFVGLADAPLPWDRIHLFWVDERMVPPDDAQSNYGLAEELLIRPARIPSDNIHRIHGENAPEQAAAEYEADIRAHFELGAGQLPVFTVIHLGMGADAHTASLFPGEPLIHDHSGIAAAVYVKKLSSSRVTLLPGVLQNAKQTVFLAAGQDKAEPLRAVLEGEEDLDRFPAQIAARHAHDVCWFVDPAAAHLLKAG